MNAEDVFALHRYWRDKRWQYEVLCRIMDAEMDLWENGRRGQPEMHTERLEHARNELEKCCIEFTTALKVVKPGPWDGIERRSAEPRLD